MWRTNIVINQRDWKRSKIWQSFCINARFCFFFDPSDWWLYWYATFWASIPVWSINPFPRGLMSPKIDFCLKIAQLLNCSVWINDANVWNVENFTGYISYYWKYERLSLVRELYSDKVEDGPKIWWKNDLLPMRKAISQLFNIQALNFIERYWSSYPKDICTLNGRWLGLMFRCYNSGISKLSVFRLFKPCGFSVAVISCPTCQFTVGGCWNAKILLTGWTDRCSLGFAYITRQALKNRRLSVGFLLPLPQLQSATLLGHMLVCFFMLTPFSGGSSRRATGRR